ncbi:TonB-dependent receptor [Brevundimonas sp. PAMC22021]|uniref:TonB-dependent receptor n=1 Tax=Brevundimonas sp. PAMC22021 TaxID=2861285 RepID=UPI001C636193|nr:TonB-dependent receptor [Brevundimonas sp. PAMC22021]QYF85649.1 TonB-dependent receptor [Brevundimonas sp. PAMC22021]
MNLMRCEGAKASLMIAASTAALCWSGAVQAQSRQFDVPAQPASTGVPAFARQADLQILASADAVAGERTAAVRGVYSVDQGLGRLLQGSNLVVASNDGRTAVLAPSAAPVIRQTAQGDQADEQVAEVDAIVVTGFRAALGSALNAKRRENGVVDVIKAEDIADFPDANLAESIQRVPGVSIARDAGEGRQITVRGLGPQFTRVRINGVEGQSTASGTDSSGGANRNRAFDFNVFASELFNSITVRKTASAETEEGSLGATVDLQTGRPFDYSGANFVLSGQYGYNDLSREWDPRFAALASNTWMDGRLGALVSVAYTKRQLLEEGHGSGGWLNGTEAGGYNPASPFSAARGADVYSPRFPRYGRLTHDQERLGLTGSLQFRPQDRTLINLDVLYSDFKATREENWLEALSFARNASQGGRPEIIVRDGVIDQNGDMIYGLFDDVDIESETRFDELDTQYSQATLSLEHEFSDRFRIKGLIGWSESDFDNPIQTTVILNRENTDGYSYDYRPNRDAPLISYGYDVTDPLAYNFGAARSEIRLRPQGVTNTIKTAQLDAGFDLNDALTLKAGVNLKRYEFDSWALARVNEGVVPQLPAGVTLSSLTKLVGGFGRNLDAPAGTVTDWTAPDLGAFADLFNIYSGTGLFELSGASNPNARGNIRSVTEDDTAAYVQMDFRTELGGVSIRGDVGVRYVKTEQSSTGYQLVAGSAQQATVERDYEDVLPALNLTAEVTPDFLVRFGAAKVMTRPNLGSVTPGGSLSTVGVFSVSSGNPYLDPIRATTYDLSAEWYFAPEALLSVGLFYKDIDSYIQTSRTSQPFNQSGLPLNLLDGLGVAPTDVFLFSQPVNTEGGPLKGLEVSYQQPFTFLPGPFNNLGAIFNVTLVDSKISYISARSPTGFVENDLVGLSKTAYNATLYYEDDRFSARVAAAYRDRYLTAVPSGTSTNDIDGVREIVTVDASASYALTDRLRLTFEGLNLTDAFNEQYTDSRRDSIYVYSHTGRQYNFGVRYTF